MYIKELSRKYADWKVIYYFLEHPTQKTYVKELSRKLRISSGTASKSMNRAAKAKILKKEIIGNVHLYTLNNKHKEVIILKQLVKRK